MPTFARSKNKHKITELLKSRLRIILPTLARTDIYSTKIVVRAEKAAMAQPLAKVSERERERVCVCVERERERARERARARERERERE